MDFTTVTIPRSLLEELLNVLELGGEKKNAGLIAEADEYLNMKKGLGS